MIVQKKIYITMHIYLFPMHSKLLQENCIAQFPHLQTYDSDTAPNPNQIFLNIEKEGILVEPFLDLRCESPPPTVYHPGLGLRKYYSTEAFKDGKTGADRESTLLQLQP